MTTMVGKIMHAAGKYQREGEEKTQWVRVGTLFRKQDGSFRIKMDAYPADTTDTGGWLAVFEDDNQRPSPNAGGGFRNNDKPF